MTQVGNSGDWPLLCPFIGIGHQVRTQILLSRVKTTLYNKFYYEKDGCVLVWFGSKLLWISLKRWDIHILLCKENILPPRVIYNKCVGWVIVQAVSFRKLNICTSICGEGPLINYDLGVGKLEGWGHNFLWYSCRGVIF